MGKKIVIWIVIIFLLIGCENNLKSSVKKELKNVLQEIIDTEIGNEVPGIQISVKTTDFGVISLASGLANINENEKMTINHNLRIASATKLFTATVIMKMVEDEIISLNDTLNKLLPQFNFPEANNITLKHLLHHTSGFWGYFNNNDNFQEYVFDHPIEYYEPAELIDKAINLHLPIKEDIGSKFFYCNTNYVLLGMIIEKYSNLSYEENIGRTISTPFNLSSTSVVNDLSEVDDMSEGYIYIEEVPIKGNQYNHSFLFAAGNIISKTSDLVLFIDQLMNNNILNEDIVDEMKTFFIDDDGNQYGLGLANFKDLGIGHNGLTLGYTSIVVYNELHDISIAVLMNCLSASGNPEVIARKILQSIIDLEN